LSICPAPYRYLTMPIAPPFTVGEENKENYGCKGQEVCRIP